MDIDKTIYIESVPGFMIEWKYYDDRIKSKEKYFNNDYNREFRRKVAHLQPIAYTRLESTLSSKKGLDN